jgi:hypothetical protein
MLGMMEFAAGIAQAAYFASTGLIRSSSDCFTFAVVDQIGL